MSKKLQIIFYAPFGKNTPANKIGGAEAGCNKTLQIYEKNGVETFCVDKPARNGSLPKYLFDIAVAITKLSVLMAKHPKALVHIVGFYDKIIDLELLLVRLVKLFGRKPVYEIRNGGMVEVYKKRDDAYRKKQDKIFRLSAGILCQGQAYVDFITERLNLPSFYYPNYILDDFIKPLQPRPKDELNLIFFGRLVPAKNIDVIIKTAALVWEKYPQTNLYLVGGISPQYKSELNSLIESLPIPKKAIKILPRQNFDSIYKLLSKSHFFIFPSSEPCEGHSNSLTEAMGCGVVPLVSTAGFNRSICGDDSLVVESLDASAYANRIFHIIDNNEWEKYSQKAYKRVSDNFTQNIIGKKLIEYLVSI